MEMTQRTPYHDRHHPNLPVQGLRGTVVHLPDHPGHHRPEVAQPSLTALSWQDSRIVRGVSVASERLADLDVFNPEADGRAGLVRELVRLELRDREIEGFLGRQNGTDRQ